VAKFRRVERLVADLSAAGRDRPERARLVCGHAPILVLSIARYNPGAVTPAYFGKAIAVSAAIVLLARRSARLHHPFPRFGPANQVTMIRALLVALIAGFIGEPPLPAAARVTVAAAAMATALDGADGWLARPR